MNEEQKELFFKIRLHLNNLHTAWSNDKNKDGHCKSSEGYMGVTFNYPNWFETEDYLNAEPEVSCRVYSYLFGPHRMHEFSSLQEAWEEVKNWTYEPEDPELLIN